MSAGSYNFKQAEENILHFWLHHKIHEKAKAKGKGKKRFNFLDGPPYTSGKVHIGTSWNKCLKDMVLRQRRMAGYDVWDRAGYDMHGLPTENKVRQKFNVFLKKDIEEFGVATFTTECEKFCIDMMHQMNATFKRLGVWMDFDNAYQPITREFISGEWFLAKRAHDKGRLYEGLRTMSWCATCQTNLAKHELEYENVTDDSIFVKLPVIGKKNEYLIIWTTTPWTIPMNLAVMVNPDIDYVRAEVSDDDGFHEHWIIAKALAAPLVTAVAGKGLKILDEFKGAKLEGVAYTHPFADVIPQYAELKKKHPKLHTVILSSEYVDTKAGSGLVHCAPGCGPEDYEVGHRNGLPPWNIVDETGKFPTDLKEFGGLTAKKDDKKFVDALRKRGALIATTPVEHDYAHCQRCHQPIIYRTTKQWFFKVEDLKDKLIAANKNITWVPQAAFNAFDSWLHNLRDNSITKQNFWGTPVPIWRCEKCQRHDVFGSVDELEQAAGKKVDKLHRPWIDNILVPCTCGGVKKRITDIFDVWVDAGTASWNSLDYPQRTDLFEQHFPADFILEGKDQIRGWFNLLHIASFIAFDKPSFKAVYMHGFIQDSAGRKMSKSLGNQIEPEEVVSQSGADTLRYYQIGSALPGLDLNYNPDDAKIKGRNLIVLWNVHNYVLDLAAELKLNPIDIDKTLTEAMNDIPERYIISKLNTAIKETTHAFDHYHLNEVPHIVEELYLELSRTYIQLTRDKASIGDIDEKTVVLHTIYTVLVETLKLIAPITPFIAEQMHQNLRNAFKLPTESVHLADWPKADDKKIDAALEKNMLITEDVMTAISHARELAKINTRWPLKVAEIVTHDANVAKAVETMRDIIEIQTNVKEIHAHAHWLLITVTVKPNPGPIGKAFGAKSRDINAMIGKLGAEIQHNLEKHGTYTMKIGNDAFEMNKDHFIIERTPPPHHVEASFKNGFVYLSTEMTPALEGEGYARELMRRVQDLRKKADLKKSDRITLFIQTSAELNTLIKTHEAKIKEKCGAASVTLSSRGPTASYPFVDDAPIKQEKIYVGFDVKK